MNKSVPQERKRKLSTKFENKELKENVKRKEDNYPPKKRSSFRSLSAFSKTFIAVLIAHAAALGILALAVQQPIVLILAGLEALIAGFTLLGIRWVPLLGSIIGAVMLYVFTSATSFPIHHLSHPKDAFGYGVLPAFSFFVFIVMTGLFWSAAMLMITGIASVIHSYFLREVRTIPWFKVALTGAICLWIGSILLGALIQPDQPITVPGSGATPIVHLQVGNFSQSSITLTKGEKLTLIDDGAYHHNISTGQWINGQPVINSQPGGPTVTNKDIDAANATLVIGPFTVAGTFYIMCSLHHNMMLKIIVQ